MERLEFRVLTADEIECRVAQVGKTTNGAGCSLLLYKDARCDQRLLDETVGCFAWKREHQLINGNLYCTVSIKSPDGEWVSKQDVGTESNTEAVKGEASDSFKRACFNWGIGRELYTAPRIFVNLTSNEVTEAQGKVRVSPKVSFKVAKIEYDEKRNINALTIVDGNGVVRYELGKQTPKATPKAAPKAAPKANDELADLFDSARAYIERATRRDDLKKIHQDYPQLKAYRPFIDALNKRYDDLGV